MRYYSHILSLFAAACLLIACNKKEDTCPSGLEIKGSVDYSGSMVQVAEGIWDAYGRFKSGLVTVNRAGGQEFISFQVPEGKEGLCRLRVKADKSYSLVHINSVSLVVTEGGVDKPRVGEKPPIEALYRGNGVWSVKDLYVATDHMRYRFLLDTDSPEQLRYWCPIWNEYGQQPSAYSDDYLKIRPLGQNEYETLSIADASACWMFPAGETDRMAAITISMNDSSPKQQIVFSTSHMGPRAIFMGDSIFRHWGSESPRVIDKPSIVIPIDPMPSWMRDDGDYVTVFWHPEFFSDNNYLDCGVSGESTTKMVARFKRDVLDADPQCVVIMGGTNDFGNGALEADILQNIKTMAQQAEAQGIKVILCAVTPCNHNQSALSNPSSKGPHIVELNRMAKEYAESKGFLYCDFHTPLVDTDGLSLQMRYRLYDDLHPNPDAYTVMEELIQPLIESVTE